MANYYSRKAKAKVSSNASTRESKQDAALARFSEMMIEKIESIQSDWQKPWFTDGAMGYPRNLSGRLYNGMNSLMLMMFCEKRGFKYPVFLTHNKVDALNYNDSTAGRVPAVDKDGNKRPIVHVLKGEKSFPVFLTIFNVKDADGNRIDYDDWKQLSESERANYNVYPSMQVYNVFNIEQTNIKEARPEVWEKMEIGNKPKGSVDSSKMFSFEPMDKMIEEDLWICPIKPTKGDDAYYSISKKMICIPLKEQFKDGESFYGNTLHEMAHSTGAEDQLNRLKPASFGSASYATEELVAELTAALCCQYYGFDKHIKDDSAAYIKSWLKSLKEDTSYIKTVLLDVKRASQIITNCIDKISAS